MTTSKIYKYIGYNGVITSKVLIDTPNKIEMIELNLGYGIAHLQCTCGGMRRILDIYPKN